VLLRGRVRTFYQKQIAQTVVAGVDGVEQIDNEIEVAPNS
jgi:osmotically-inducible protein OsmY